MNLLVDGLATGEHISFMQMNATGLSVEGISTEISSQSQALQKFMDTYRHFSEALSAYQTIINNDLQNVTNAVNAFIETDTKQSEQLDIFSQKSNKYFLQP